MNILFIEFEPIGGPPHRLIEFAQFLSSIKNNKYNILIACTDNSVLKNIKGNNIASRSFGWNPDYQNIGNKTVKYFAYLKTLKWLFINTLKFKPDVIYCNHYQWVAYGTPLAFFYKAPLIVHFRDCWPLISRFTIRTLSIWKDTYYISISKYVKNLSEKLYSLPKNKSFLVYDGIINSSNKQPFAKTNKKSKIIISVSRLEPKRNLEVFTEAACIVCSQFANVEFQHFGFINNPSNMKYLNRLRSIVNNAGFDKRIKFLPYADRNKIIDQYKNSYLNLITSVVFALPNSAIESLMCGVPAIATEGSGNGEVITDGFNGFLVKEPKAYFFAEAIMKYLKKPDIYSKHKSNSILSVEKKFNAYKSYEGILKVITLASGKH